MEVGKVIGVLLLIGFVIRMIMTFDGQARAAKERKSKKLDLDCIH